MVYNITNTHILLKILIVGGGVGGLALAALLRKQGQDVLIVEKAPEWKTIGFVLGIFPNGLNVLRKVGVAEELVNASAKIPGHIVKDGEGHVLSSVDFHTLESSMGPVVEMERDVLHKALRDANTETNIRLATTVKNLNQDTTGVDVEFSDGSKDRFDIVVGADGINSAIREYVRPRAHKMYTGVSFWLMWINNTQGFNPEVVYYFGKGKGVALFPCKGSDHIAASFVVPAKEHCYKDCSSAFLREHFKDMADDIPHILERMPEQPTAIFHNDDNEMHVRKWYEGRVVLLGDAVHALSPILGMGASMALEDAAVLADELQNPTSIASAFKRYKKRRYARVKYLAWWSWGMHRLICLSGPLYFLRNFCIKRLFGWYYNCICKFLAKPI